MTAPAISNKQSPMAIVLIDPTTGLPYKLSTGTLVGGTQGSVVFLGSGGTFSQDNANLFWDDTNNRLGIGTNAPDEKLHIVGSVNGPLRVEVNNANSGAAATSELSLENDADKYLNLFVQSSGAPGGGAAVLSTDAPLGLSFATYNTGSIYINPNYGVLAAPTAIFAPDGTLQLGVNGVVQGKLSLAGLTSGSVFLTVQAAAGTYNFNLPPTAGAAGQALVSAGGAGSPMTWGIGAFSANADAPVTGYVTIVDSSGTSRKLAVIA